MFFSDRFKKKFALKLFSIRFWNKWYTRRKGVHVLNIIVFSKTRLKFTQLLQKYTFFIQIFKNVVAIDSMILYR